MAGRYIEIMDTTLRDGEQMKDSSYTPEEKFTIASILLEEVKVDRIEIASARVSEGEQEAVSRVMRWARDRKLEERIEVLGFVDGTKSVDWIRDCGGCAINLLTKGSLNHLTTQLKKKPEEHVGEIRETIRHARDGGLVANIYLEDWSNGMTASRDYVFFMVDRLKDSGIRRFMLPDTLGVLSPRQVYDYMSDITGRYPDLHFDFHGHNDYGLATANTIAAVEGGARGVHCTVNGVGERAGNTSLDETIVGIRDFLGYDTGTDEKKLVRVSQTVEIFTGRRVAFNKPITGTNVFTQTAGIHADGDHKGNLYHSRLQPERFSRKRQYALGKLSGKSNLDYNLKALGIVLTPEQKKLVLDRIVTLGDRKQTITQEDIPYIISDVLETPRNRHFELRSCVVVSSLGLNPMATVKLAYREDVSGDFTEYEESAQGDGGYDAFMNAIRRITQKLGLTIPRLSDYQVTIPSGGKTDALVQCSITWQGANTFVTKGVNSDQVLAAAEATEKMLNLSTIV